MSRMILRLSSVVPVVILTLLLVLESTVYGAIDLEISVEEMEFETGLTIFVEFMAVSDSAENQDFERIGSFIVWDRQFLSFENWTTPDGIWQVEGFGDGPSGTPNFDLNDGDAHFSGFNFPGTTSIATVEGTVYLTMEFLVEDTSCPVSTLIQLDPGFSVYPTTVIGPGFTDATGDISSTAEFTTCPPRCSPDVGDVNGDMAFDLNDAIAAVDVLLDPDAATPEAVAATDANCDGVVNGLDIQPLIDFLTAF